jgi:sulfoxide reductase heme-binding subunit YedZ
MAAFLLLCALALTSTSGWVRRLGKRWVVLHRAIYAISVLGIIHYWMSVKADISEPAMYGMFFAVLLGYRVWHSMRSPSRRPVSNHSPQQNSAPSA